MSRVEKKPWEEDWSKPWEHAWKPSETAAPAKGFGDASGNYTREMSPVQIAGNQFLNVLEGLGVDPESPILGTVRNFIKGGGEMVERVMEAPVSGTAGVVKDLAMAPVHAVQDLASGNAEQSARGAGQFLASAPILSAELKIAQGLKNAGVGAARAGATRVLPEAIRLKEMANAAQDYRMGPSAQPLTAAERADMPRTLNLTRQGTRVVKRGTAAVTENLLNRAANFKAGTESHAGVAGAPEVGSAAFMPETMRRNPPPEGPISAGLPKGTDQYRPQFTEGEPIQGEVPGNPRQFDATGRPRGAVDLNTSTPVPTVLTAPELNKWMNVRENQLLYGKNPGERILSENLLGADKATTLQNVATVRKSVGSAMEEVFKRAESEGVKFEIESDIQAAISDAKKTIGKSSDETFMKAIEGIENDIVSRTEDLKSMTPSAAHELEVELGRGVKWTGASSDVQRLLKDIRGRISKKLKTIEGIVPLKERWGDLFEGEQALKSSMRKDAIGRGTGPTPQDKITAGLKR